MQEILYLIVKKRLFCFDSELLLLPPLLKLGLVVVHHIVGPVEIGLDGGALPHNVLHPLVAGEAPPGGHVPVQVRHSSLDIPKSLVKHLHQTL